MNNNNPTDTKKSFPRVGIVSQFSVIFSSVMRLPDGGEGFAIRRDASGLSLLPPAVIRLSHTGEYRYMVPENTQG